MGYRAGSGGAALRGASRWAIGVAVILLAGSPPLFAAAPNPPATSQLLPASQPAGDCDLLLAPQNFTASTGAFTLTASAPGSLSGDASTADGSSADASAADTSTAAPLVHPPALSLVQPLLADDDEDVQSVYAPIQPQENQGVNEGGAHIDISAMYFNHYVYRGVNHSAVGGSGDSTNLEIDARLTFDLGNLPHPYVGVFNNVYDSDPVSRFQEIRPYFGLDWYLLPLIVSAGQNTYIYPNREDLNTAEFWGQFTLDDSILFHTAGPIFSPYFYGAYDYTKNNGWYFEAGIKHDFTLEDMGMTFSPYADAAYILGYQQQFVYINSAHDSGFQHYDVGLNFKYSLNTLFNISHRFGEFDLKAEVAYTGKLQKKITADDITWGGVGIGFSY